jgi:hypothetical protein
VSLEVRVNVAMTERMNDVKGLLRAAAIFDFCSVAPPPSCSCLLMDHRYTLLVLLYIQE